MNELRTDREWLETDGLGSYASATEGDCLTRKYHGLLVTPLSHFEGRFVLLSEARMEISSPMGFTLGSHRYPGAVYPEGYRDLHSFDPYPFPSWIYDNGAYRVKKEIAMVPGDAAVYVSWTLIENHILPGMPVQANLKLYHVFRGVHHLACENRVLNPCCSDITAGFSCQPYDALPAMGIQYTQNVSRKDIHYWDHNIEYDWERRRGFDYREDRFVTGGQSFTLYHNRPFIMRASLQPHDRDVDIRIRDNYQLEKQERRRVSIHSKSVWEKLFYHSRHFWITNRKGELSLNAGYPWFGEWGRDTMIALPGLSLPEKLGEGLRVLADYAKHIKKGLLPNTLGEMQGFTSYNSIDGSLLYLRAVDLLLKKGDGELSAFSDTLVDEIFPAVYTIVLAFLEEKVPHVRLTSQGLLWGDKETSQSTWMDAMVDGVPVTPRYGFVVELNALWYQGLGLCLTIGNDFPRSIREKIRRMYDSFPKNFSETFYDREEGCLRDTVNDETEDHSLRPNMLFATAVGLLPQGEGENVVQWAKKKLLTPMGVRTLSPDDPRFISHYEGNGTERDRAYHQGTVWPWLLGIMVESSLNYCQDLGTEKALWRKYLTDFIEAHLDKEGIDSISEVLDGGHPHKGKGCFAQAWSVGEVMRAWRLANE